MDALIRGNSFAPFPSTGVREQLEAEADAIGMEAMAEKLRAIDPESAAHSMRNPRRIIRALEVYYESGETITAHNLRTQSIPPKFSPLWIGLNFEPRAALYARVNARVDIMLENGLLEEIKDLLASGISPTCTAMQAIGYKEYVAYLRGETTLEEATELLKMGSRRYAKRQLSWFRRNQDIHWLTRYPETTYEEILNQARQLVLKTDN